MATFKKGGYRYDYPRPAVTVDVVLSTRESRPRVLLIQRKQEPYAGLWALPGGFVEDGETLAEAARREVLEETSVVLEELEQLYTAGDPGRDPRGWTVSVVYLARGDAKKIKPRAGDDAAEVKWFFLDDPPDMAFDHLSLLARAETRLLDREV